MPERSHPPVAPADGRRATAVERLRRLPAVAAVAVVLAQIAYPLTPEGTARDRLTVATVLLFARYIHPLWAGVLGALFVIGRAVYAVGYYSAADKRGPGAGITGIVNLVLLAGALFGVIRALLYQP